MRRCPPDEGLQKDFLFTFSKFDSPGPLDLSRALAKGAKAKNCVVEKTAVERAAHIASVVARLDKDYCDSDNNADLWEPLSVSNTSQTGFQSFGYGMIKPSPFRLVVRTSSFHVEDTGSIPVRDNLLGEASEGYHPPPFPRSFSRGIVACSTWVAWCNFRSTLRQDLSPVRASKASISKDWAAMLHLYRSQSL